ncbi:MAG: ATP-binding protein [Lachnospiraceae bacterium]|nr:ATP-binding protein [Lachnospiraceae bacterium]
MKVYVNSLQKKMFWLAFITAVFTELTQIVALTVDSIVVCVFMGEREIAAVGITGPFFFLVGVPASCLAAGLQTICSHEMGRGHIEQVSKRLSEVLMFAGVTLLAVTVLLFLLVPQTAFLFGARGNAADLLELTSQYLYGLVGEIFPFVAMSVLTPVIILDNGSRRVMAASIAGCVSNIIFDFVVAVRQLGLFGIGLGSTLSVIISLCILLTHFTDKNRLINLQRVRVSSDRILEVVRLGLPQAAHSFANMIRVWMLNILVIVIGGDAAMSVMTVNGTIMDFVDVVAVGIAGAVGILAGIAYGEKNGEEMEGAVHLGYQYIIVASALIMGGLLVLTHPVAEIFIDPGSGAHPLLLFAIRCLIVGILPNALIYSRVSYLQAIGKTQDAQLLEMAVNMVSLTAFAFILSVPFGAYGVFAAFPVSKIFVLVVYYIRHAGSIGRFRLGERDFMGLDDSFYPPVRNIIAYPVDTLEECALASEQVWLFCKGHHFDKRTAFFSSVCIEEILTNIILHGNENRRKKVNPTAEIRVTLADNDLIMRVRDNGVSFHMNTLAKMVSDESDPFAGVGLKIICAAAKEIKYYRLYGMNTTIIRIGAAEENKKIKLQEEEG